MNNTREWLSRNWGYLLAAALIVAIFLATMSWTEWLQKYSGAVQAGAVGVLVVVTGLYAWQTKTQADASMKMVEEMERTRAASLRPIIAFYAGSPAEFGPIGEPLPLLDHSTIMRCTCLVMVNKGAGPALNLIISGPPPGIIVNGLPYKEPSRQELSFLAQDETFWDYLGMDALRRLGHGEQCYILVSYEDVFGNPLESVLEAILDSTGEYKFRVTTGHRSKGKDT